jgi:hypothetical protein
MVLRTGYVFTVPSRLGNPSPLLCDNIDPATNDYVSLFSTIDPIDAQVILALKIRRNSGASVVVDGNRFHEVRKMSDSAQSEIGGLIKEALGRLIDQLDIQYKGASFTDWDPSNQTCTVEIKWVNLRARDREIRTYSLNISGAA